jgi:hypothetical protein
VQVGALVSVVVSGGFAYAAYDLYSAITTLSNTVIAYSHASLTIINALDYLQLTTPERLLGAAVVFGAAALSLGWISYRTGKKINEHAKT